MNSEFLISIIMPVYNGERYLKEAIDSILNQSYVHWELIVVDDGSSDSSLSILRDYAARDRRIRIIQNKKNVGLPAALNIGLTNTTGAFIARHDADDISHPDRFRSQLEFLQEYQEIGLLGCNGNFLDQDGNPGNECNLPTEHNHIVQAIVNAGFPFLHGSWMFRRSCIERVGTYNEIMFACEDKDLWLRISEQFQTANLPEPLYQYRLHTEAFTTKTLARSRFYRRLHMDLYWQRQQNQVDVLGTRKGSLFVPEKISPAIMQSIADVAKANEYVGTNQIISMMKYSLSSFVRGWNTPYIWRTIVYVNKFFFQSIFKSASWHVKNLKSKVA